MLQIFASFFLLFFPLQLDWLILKQLLSFQSTMKSFISFIIKLLHNFDSNVDFADLLVMLIKLGSAEGQGM